MGATIDDVDPKGGRLCDLFAGTGVVGASVSDKRGVTSIDIQEYSRVLCSALLSSFSFDEASIQRVIAEASHGKLYGRLLMSLAPIVKYEEECISRAEKGNPKPLAELLESPPLKAFVPELSRRNGLDRVKEDVLQRLSSDGLQGSPDSTVTRYFGGVYFSFRQAAAMDALLSAANGQPTELQDAVKSSILSRQPGSGRKNLCSLCHITYVMFVIIGWRCKMTRGESGRIVIEIDPAMKRRLYSILALSGITLKEWFVHTSEEFIETHEQKTRLTKQKPLKGISWRKDRT